MKISDIDVQLQSSHQQSSRLQSNESLRAWVGGQRPNFEGAAAAPAALQPSTVVQLSNAASNALAADTSAVQDPTDDSGASPELSLLKTLVEAMLGKKIDVLSAQDLQPDTPPVDIPDATQAQPQGQSRAGWGLEYDRHITYDEVEQTQLSAQGVIHTADGKQISFSLDLAMTRAYHYESDVSVRAGDGVRKDPLVINFAGTAAQLTSTRFQFDLENDGKLENVPTLAGGSGFLALDANGNGKIDSGAELFGTRSGNGFADLAAHDDDGNGWIDENDSVYNGLRVWTPDANGAGSLSTLKDRNIGAILLGSLKTPFELRTADNQSLGAVRSSGLYFADDGKPGSVQQVDLSV